MNFLVVDGRFGTPIHVFLELDPRGTDDYPGLAVLEINFESLGVPSGPGRRCAIGRDPWQRDHFREFGSDGAVAGAGYILIEPRYVGPTWQSYARGFRPEGEKAHSRGKRSGGAAQKA